MESIKHTYTLQWVGPFNSYDEYREYITSQDSLDSSYFNIYYFQARMDRRFNVNRYLGIHTINDGIEKRLNRRHEHFGSFVDAKDLKIWIASFADPKQQKPQNVDNVETLFIQAYNEFLNLNTQKKKSLPKDSICVVNMWFDSNDKIKRYNIEKPDCFDDVLIFYGEEEIFYRGSLHKMNR